MDALLIDLDAAPIEVQHPKAPGFVVELRPLSDRAYLRALAPLMRRFTEAAGADGKDIEVMAEQVYKTEEQVLETLKKIVVGWRGLVDAKTNQPVNFTEDRLRLLIDSPAFNWPETFTYTDKDTGEEKEGKRLHLFYNDLIGTATSRMMEIQAGKA